MIVWKAMVMDDGDEKVVRIRRKDRSGKFRTATAQQASLQWQAARTTPFQEGALGWCWFWWGTQAPEKTWSMKP